MAIIMIRAIFPARAADIFILPPLSDTQGFVAVIIYTNALTPQSFEASATCHLGNNADTPFYKAFIPQTSACFSGFQCCLLPG